MSSTLMAVTFDAADAGGLAAFWGGVFGRDVVPEPGGALLPGYDTQVGLRFMTADTEKSGPNRLHLHLTSQSREDQQATVARAVKLGGRHLDVGQLPDEEHVVLADCGGNEFCVIGPGNNFLSGCGFLGEISCDGTRDVGLSGATRSTGSWSGTRTRRPLSSPKVSWGGPPVALKSGRNRQRFDLATDDLPAEVERRVAPDGNEFCVRPT